MSCSAYTQILPFPLPKRRMKLETTEASVSSEACVTEVHTHGGILLQQLARIHLGDLSISPGTDFFEVSFTIDPSANIAVVYE